MTDPYSLLIQGAQQYAADEAAQSPWSMVQPMAQGLQSVQTRNPYAQIAMGLGSGFMQGAAAQGLQDVRTQAQNDAFSQFIGGQISPRLQPYASAAKLAAMNEQAQFDRDLKKTAINSIRDFYKQATIEGLKTLASPENQRRVAYGQPTINPFLQIIQGAIPANAPVTPQDQVATPPEIPDSSDVLKSFNQESSTGRPVPTNYTFDDALEEAGGNPDVAEDIYSRNVAERNTRINLERDFRNDFQTKHLEVKEFPEIEVQTARVIQSANQNNPIADKDLAIAFVKLSDPKGTAQLGETKAFERAENFLSRIAATVGKELYNESGFTEAGRIELMKAAKRIYDERAEKFDRRFKQFSSLEQRHGLEPGSVTGEPRKPLFQDQAQAPTPPPFNPSTERLQFSPSLNQYRVIPK